MVTYGSAVEAKYSEEEILDALQKKIELLDPDASFYYDEAEKKMVGEFLAQHKDLFESLGNREALYYVKLVKMNKNAILNPTFAIRARDVFLKYRDEYSGDQESYLEQVLVEFEQQGYLQTIIDQPEASTE